MKKHVLVVVDVQNDFITGSLANKEAENVLPRIMEEVNNPKYDSIVFTMDTHMGDYFSTAEGKALPISHCICHTKGWDLPNDLDYEYFNLMLKDKASKFMKPTFGSIGLWEHIRCHEPFAEEITLIGFDTDICVVSNALILKTQAPEVKINVIADACAGSTKEKHEAALKVMESCQINIL